MERRDFLRRSMYAGLATGAGLTLGFDNIWASGTNNYAAPFDMVAVRGGEAEMMFEKAIASLGGMKAYVKKNQTVVVKPNIGWDVSPEKAANT
ncbi:MAG: tat (twin-arginine translocation) pathway signal sequence, partial [Bacteroidetes bacterium]|nr:tat (twin-arginine translocation) pathway signal sequence [Bacteroidota bacterium]